MDSKKRPKFIGREIQLEELRKVLNSDNPELVAIYGRRRVGKTFLVRHAVDDKFAFYYTAAYNISKKDQLSNFVQTLKMYSGDENVPSFHNWFEAFHYLGAYLHSIKGNKNKVVFIDELPWADSPKSGFLSAFENFWNTECAFHKDIKVVVCGSATSWIINKVLNNKGGLYGRITHRFLIEPFSLWETSQYFKAFGYRLGERQVAEIYMAVGGIPYYLSLFEKGESVTKNIDRLFFKVNGVFKNEFENLYRSLFRNPGVYLDVIRELGKKGQGLTRQDLIDRLKISSNGAFSNVLKELEDCGFIRSYLPFENKYDKNGKKIRNKITYQLIDLFSLFCIRFGIEVKLYDEDFWASHLNDPRINVWRGLSFETLVLWHIPQVKEALGISGMSVKVCSWHGKNIENEKAQIDLLLVRKDNVVNICEMKYSTDSFIITKKYLKELEQKISVFLQSTKTKMTPVMTFITNNGIKPNQYSEVVQKEVILQQLFRY